VDAPQFVAVAPAMDYPAAYVAELVEQSQDSIDLIQLQLNKAQTALNKLRFEVRKA
jgi:hypothetical protein